MPSKHVVVGEREPGKAPAPDYALGGHSHPYAPAGHTHGKSELNLFVQPTAPDTIHAQYVWVETELGNAGTDFTFWIEDGVYPLLDDGTPDAFGAMTAGG